MYIKLKTFSNKNENFTLSILEIIDSKGSGYLNA